MNTLSLPTPRNVQEAAFQIRVVERAAHLFEQGYHYMNCAVKFPEFGNPDLWLVWSEENPKGYIVRTDTPSCECTCFQKSKFCKHYLAIEKMLLECDEADRRAEEAENDEGAFSTNYGGVLW